MMLIVSALVVLGTLALVFTNMVAEGTLPLGYEQMIHARIPWLILAALALGGGLGIASLVRRRSIARYAIVGVELALGGLLASYFVTLSFLPPHSLALQVGDSFPVRSLSDQDGTVHQTGASPDGGPALYVFYRGDW